MAIGTLSPSGKQYFWNVTTGLPLAGGSVYTYLAGTSTPQATYQDSALSTANTNPIVLNSAGYATIYIPVGVSIKMVVNDVNGVLQWSQDNMSAVPASSAAIDITGTAGENLAANAVCYLSDGSGSKNAGQWYNADTANAYSSITPLVGIATVAITSGANGAIRLGGALSNFTNLTAGADYFVGTAGALTSTAPANRRYLGKADSSTTVLDLQYAPSVNASLLDNGINDFRLTLTSGLAVTTADVTAATTIYCTPARGTRIMLYDGTQWNLRTSAEFSIPVPATTSQMYDVFVYDNAGVPTLELLAWTNDTTRATALVLQDGNLVKTGALTRRFQGSCRTTGVAGQTEDSAAKRYLWNAYNQARRPLLRKESTGTWSYTTLAWRQVNGSTANQVEVVIGFGSALLYLVVTGTAQNTTGTTVSVGVGIGEDSTTTLATGYFGGSCNVGTSLSPAFTMSGFLMKYPTIGRHFYAWLEDSTASGITNWFGATGNQVTDNGIGGFIEG